MQILRVEDPRDPLTRATRYELCQIAKHYGIKEITYGCSLQLPQMIEILRDRGVRNFKIPDRPLGVQKQVIVNADDLGLQDKTQVQAVAQPIVEQTDKPVSEMNMTEMRKECKRRGIPMVRTDNLKTLREKLGG